METLIMTLKLEMAYTINSFQYHLRRTPLIKRLFKNSSYEVKDVKTAFSIIAEFIKILKILLFSALFFAIPSVSAGLRLEESPWSSRYSLFILFVMLLFLCGSIGNNALISVDANDYYAVCLLRMDARKYFLSTYFLTLTENFLTTMLFTLIIALIFHGSLWFVLILPVFQFCLKVDMCAVRFILYRRKGIIAQDPVGKRAWIPFMVVFLAAIGLLTIGLVVPTRILAAICLVPLLPVYPALRYVLRFDDYLIYFKRLYAEKTAATAALKTNAIVMNSKLIDVKATDITSDKTGFAFMNEAFEKRHHKLISDPIKKISLLVGAAAVGIIALALFNPGLSEAVCDKLMSLVIIMPFLFYIINRGQNYTAALFANCDRTLLNYSFYRKPGNILRLFRIRLLSITRQNLLPAGIISIGLVTLQIVSSFTVYGAEGFWKHTDLLNLVLLFVAPLSISIFFSTHYLTLYYLIQPFDSEAKTRAPLYSVCTVLTYILCYWMTAIDPLRNLLNSNPIMFTVILVAFCLVYSGFSCFLVYKIGPRTFKPRR